MFRSSIKRTTTDGSAESTGRQMEPYRSVFTQAVNLLGKLGIEMSDITGHVDPVWNRAHSRYRTIFNDRTGLNASLNTKPVLVQAYRRDMSGDKFALMKDSSAPIVVNGRHWGGLRMAYRPPVA
jgi:methyl-accepting chemotaxis protein